MFINGGVFFKSDVFVKSDCLSTVVVPLAMTRTNGPRTHTSDNSYMYQLSLVVAIASISFGGSYRDKSMRDQHKNQVKWGLHTNFK